MRISRKTFATLGAAVLLSSLTVSGAQAAASPEGRYDPAMLKSLASSLGVSRTAAAERLDHETSQQRTLTTLERKGVATDGAFFDAQGDLVVNAENAQAAGRLADAGLLARTTRHGENELNKIKAQLDAAALDATPAGISSWEVDLASDTVTVKVSDAAAPAARSFLNTARAHGDAGCE
ncbi:alpha-lytic protease prodomain-containing protein [Streptomyces sp. NPDC004539]|uniref:alpha-lytic protease prodomain-containing protein n=1 Tax=Streptomyces sp. NPDC004539 TaxID=3154280 RepID=UPI0033B11FE8